MSLKKVKTEHVTCSAPSLSGCFDSLPKDVLTRVWRVVQEEEEADTSRLFALATLSRSARAALLSLAYSSIAIADASGLVFLARTLKKNTSLSSHVRKLEIYITNIYSTELGNKAASNWKGHSLKNVLMLCTSLVSLALHLGPSNASSPLLYLFKDLTTVFSGLKCLESFALPSSELWLHDLATLLACWPKLKTVELEKLRGDVHARRENEAGPIRSVIRTISVNNSTIASRHVEWLLRDQAELCSLELAVPATTHDCRAFDAVATVASNIETLNVWNTYSGASSSRSKSASTSTIPSDSSPLSRVLSNASSLTSLHLYVNLNPSIVLSCLEETDLPKLRRLAIEDTAASGVRVALEEALRAGKLAQLEEVISFGSMRGNSRSNEAGKKLAKVCREKGIEWSDE